MNIYFINALSAKLGGGKTYIFNLLDNLPDYDVKVYIVCQDKTVIPNDQRVVLLNSDLANKNILFRMLWEVFYLPFLLMKFNISVLFVPGGMDFTFFTFGIPKVTMFRNMLPFDRIALDNLVSKRLKFKNLILKYLMLRTMRTAKHVIFISNYAKDRIISKYLIKNSTIIYHGISKLFSPENVSKIQKEYILYVSRFEPYKNHINLIMAYDKLGYEYKEKYNLILVGELLEPNYSECINYINKHNLSDYIFIKGALPYNQLPRLYNESSLFIFPSSCENCPNILLEAIGCGVPVITSKSEPMPEFTKYRGLYFDENNYEDIYKCLLKVLSEPGLLMNLKKQSMSLRFDYLWKNTASMTWDCLKKIGDKNVQK